MSLDIVYTCGNDEFRFRATSEEFETLARFAEKKCRKAFGSVFGRASFDRAGRGKVTALCAAMRIIMDEIRRSPDSLGYIYTSRSEYPRGSGFVTAGSGSMGGIKIKGEEFSLEVGNNTCTLTKYWYDEEGKPHGGEPQDIRHLTFIKTDQDSFSGDVTISKRKAGKAVLKKLAELERFLAACPEEVVTIRLG